VIAGVLKTYATCSFASRLSKKLRVLVDRAARSSRTSARDHLSEVTKYRAHFALMLHRGEPCSAAANSFSLKLDEGAHGPARVAVASSNMRSCEWNRPA